MDDGKLFQQVFKISSACLLMKVNDPFFTIIDVSDKYLELTSTTWEQLIGKDAFDIFPDKPDQPDGAIKTRAAILEVVQTGKQVIITDYLYYIRVPITGRLEPFWWNSIFDPIFNGNGVVEYVLGTAIDNTGQHISAHNLKEAEQMLHLAIQAADIGTWSINADTKEIISSDRSKELYGLSKNDHITVEEVLFAIDGNYREKVSALLSHSMQSDGTKSFVIDYPLNGIKDGKQRWVRSNAKMFFNIAGNERLLCGTLVDITESKIIEQNKNDFIGMVSHELRTPLTTLTAVMQIAAAKLKDSDNKQLVNAIERGNVQVTKMNGMIKGFLDIAQLESGQMRIEKQTFDIDDLLHQVVDELKLIVNNHEIKLRSCNPIQVNADREQIGLVISNLINNAVKYSLNGKPIIISCEQREDDVIVSVEDEGVGIGQNELEQIFDRYYRIKGKDMRNISGFGIGLYLSAEIIKQHNGKIWAESQPGAGSTFFFTLPL